MFYRYDNGYSPKHNFKKEWSYYEQKGVECELEKMFKENYGIKNVDDYFGLPYTSSGKFAELSNTNVKFEVEEGYNLESFLLDHNDNLFATASDEDGNERYYLIEDN